MEGVEVRAYKLSIVFVICSLLSICFPFLNHVHYLFQMVLALESAVVEQVAVLVLVQLA